MIMTRRDYAIEVLVCLMAVAGFTFIGAVAEDNTMIMTIAYANASIFLIFAIWYSWHEHKARKAYDKHLEKRLDEIL